MTATFILTTDGLQVAGTGAVALPNINWAVAAGTADIITAAFTPVNAALTDGLPLSFRASAANLTSTPTFAPDGLPAHTLTKSGGQPLLAGDIPAAGAEVIVRFNLAGLHWEVLNPFTEPPMNWAVATGGADAITASYSPANLALTDGLLLGLRGLTANLTQQPTFAPDGLAAKQIYRWDGKPLQPGDIQGSATGAEYLLRYNLSATVWFLMNPSTDGSIFKALTADDTGGQNVNTVQPIFPTAGGISVQAATIYDFDAFIFLTRAAGAVSHTTSIQFGGTATLTEIAGFVDVMTGDANTLVSTSGVVLTSAAATVIKAASTSTTEFIAFRVTGSVKINAGGTFIPEFIYSAAPGGAPTIKTGSFWRMTTRALNPQGLWA